jgi:hypothetical protein
MYGDLRRGWVLDLGGCGALTFLIPFAYPSYLGRSPWVNEDVDRQLEVRRLRSRDWEGGT